MYHGDGRIKKWSILMASFWQQFSHSKRDFWLETTIPENFYIFWE